MATEIRRGAQANAWERLPGGELLFLAVMVVAVSLILAADNPAPTGKMIALALLAVCWVLTALVSRRGPIGQQRDWVAGGYAVLLVALYTIAAVIAPTSSFALFALGPKCFMILPTRRAFAVVTVLNLTPALRFALGGGDTHDILNFIASAALVVTFSLVIGIWMCRVIEQSAERADLIEQLQATRSEVAKLSKERGAMAERERLARDIHDTLAQGFTSIIMLLEAAESSNSVGPEPGRHIRRAVRTARENLAEARALVSELTPPVLNSSLTDALRRLAARQEDVGLAVAYRLVGTPRPLPAEHEVALLRAAQEGLANVRKHAKATWARLSLSYRPDEVSLLLQDNGRGFDPSAPCTGFGLTGMRSRIQQAGGSFDVCSDGDSGTTIELVIPSTTVPDTDPERSCHQPFVS